MTSEIACASGFASMPMDRWLKQRENNEQPSSSSGVASPLRHDVLDTYGKPFCTVDSRPTTVQDSAYSKSSPYLELQDLDLMSWVSSNPGQRQLYQEAGVKPARFVGCKSGELESEMSRASSNMMGTQRKIGSKLSEEMAQSSQLPPESALAPPPPQAIQQQPDYSRPSSSSSSLRSISVGSPECSSFLRSMGGGATSSCQQLPDAVDPAQGFAQPLVPTPTATAGTYSRFRDATASQFPSPRSDDLALMKAMLAVLSNPLSRTETPTPAADSNIHPSSPSPQAPAAGVGRAGAFMPYRLGPSFRRFKQAGSSSGHSMIRRLHSMLRTIDGLRAEESAAAAAAVAHVSTRGPTTNQLHHMISERRRREKLNESFQALRALLPPGTKRDKASVLSTTKDYLANLKAQILDLEEKNQMLESKLPTNDQMEELSTSLMGRPTIQIIQASQATLDVQQINVIFAMRAECDVLDVVLSILECIKDMGFLSLVSLDVDHIESSQVVKAKFTLQVNKGAEWDEGAFKEAMAMVVDEVVSRKT